VRTIVPTFYLYGEPPRVVEESFVHVEALDDRSRPSEWTIQPHAHAELAHIFLVDSGGGAMRADAEEMHFTAPCLLLVPAAVVHGFQWFEDSSGSVITMAMSYVAELVRHDIGLATVFEKAATIPLTADTTLAGHLISRLMQELSWSALGHRAAVSASLMSLLVLALRNDSEARTARPEPGHHAAMIARLRERIEQRFRLREPIGTHAAALGVSETALRVACSRVARQSPAQMLDQRALLEARRALLYSNLSIAEIGFSIGFSDPAYFTRFFTRHIGRSPRQYRRDRG